MQGDAANEPPATRLARRLGTTDAVVVGLSAMVGAGVFAAFAPAAQAAGVWLLAGLGIAAVIAYANAATTATLAAAFPTSGGGYAYARQLLSVRWGFIAGWAFLTGKTASAAAMALTFGAYVFEPMAKPLAVGVVVAVTAVNYFGVRKTAVASRIIVVGVLAVLAFVVTAAAITPATAVGSAGEAVSVYGVLQSAGLMFFAFAGYARLATLGEEVKDPARTIPRAVTVALVLALVVYLVVGFAALRTLGASGLAQATAPLVEVVVAGPWASWAGIVTFGAALATVGALLSLTAGMSRTAFAMAAEGELPRPMAQVGQRHQVPQVAGMVIATVVSAAVIVGDLRQAIGFSSFAVLAYYAIGHVALWRLPGLSTRRRITAVVGFSGCALMCVTLPWQGALAALVVLLAGAGMHHIGHSRRPR